MINNPKEKIKKEVYDFINSKELTKEEIKYIDEYFLTLMGVVGPILEINLSEDQARKLATLILNKEAKNV
jgi:hypothetical protein